MLKKAAKFKTLWRHLRRKLLEPVAGYTRFVLLTKHGLLLTAVFIVMWLIIMPLVHPVHERFHLSFTEIGKSASEKPKMQNPRFQGVDGNGHPFNITADYAEQESENVVQLYKLQGDMVLEDNGWMSVSSNEGTLHNDKNILLLKGNVNLFTDSGYEFKTESATVYTKESRIEGDEKIQGQGPTGVLYADSFQVEDGGKHLVFKKHVKLIIYPGTKG